MSNSNKQARKELSLQMLLGEEGCFPSEAFSIGMTLFWVERSHVTHVANASAEYVSRGKVGVYVESPVPAGATVWLVLASGSGIRGIAQSCQAVPQGYQTELRLLA